MKKLNWLQWQLRNKYIFIAIFLEILASIALIFKYDYGGWYTFIVFTIISLLVIKLGVINLWKEYKNDKLS